eukprot:g1144.t2 g1144  g1144.t1 contig10:1473802-1478244(-)
MKFSSVSFIAVVMSPPTSSHFGKSLGDISVVSASMVSESIITTKKKRVSGGTKSLSDRKERRKLDKEPRKVRQWKPNQVEEEDFNSSTALGLLESTKTRTLQVTNCSIDDCTCTMSDGSDGKKCDGEYACDGMNPNNAACGSCNGDNACQNAFGTIIGENSCNGGRACREAHGAEIGTDSCNGVTACDEAFAATIGDESCIGEGVCIHAHGAVIGDITCVGEYACSFANGLIVGNGSCQGYKACNYAFGSTVGNDSCIEHMACYGLYTTVADESCNEYKACSYARAHVGTGSCNHVYACRGGKGSIGSDSCNEFMTCQLLEGRVHAYSCNDGDYSCASFSGNILEGSCNAEKSCYEIAAMISTGSCNAVEACYGVNGYDIGGCACNTANECKCSSVPGAYVCDDSSDVFTNAQDATCPVGAGQWFPDWAGANLGCVKNVGSNNAPSYMLYNPSMWMFDDLEDCCDKNYPWDLATCLGASAAAGSDKWFVNYSLNKCVKECVGDEPCGGLVDGSWVDLFESQSECCSKKVWWNTECNA